MPTIYDAVTPKLLAERWINNANQRIPFMGEAFFRTSKQIGTELSYLQGKKPKVRPLNLSSYDAKVIYIGAEGFKTIQTEIPFFKNAKKINEKQRQQLNNVMNTGNERIINAIRDNILDDNGILLANADITREMMRMQALTTGVIAFANNGQAIEYDYEIPEDNKIKADWHKATAKPVSDIVKAKQVVLDKTGDEPTNLLMNSNTLALLSEIDSIKNALYVFANGTVDPLATEAQTFVEKRAKVTIYVYDKGYMDEETGKFVKFVPDDLVVMFPDGPVGDGVFGTTPEESDLLNSLNAEVSVVDTGVAITKTDLTDPVTVETKVSMSYLPTLEQPDTIILLDVSAQE